MKTKLSIILTLLFCSICIAQNGINYKAVIKDGTGTIVANDLIQVQFTILDGAVNVYQETHSPTTDDNGIIIINIGEGTPISGTFSNIDWSSNNHFLNVQVNTGGGLQDMGTTAFKSVPYALIAKNLENPLWSLNGSSAYYNAGSVGIGTNTPTSIFEILGAGTTIPKITSTGGTTGLALFRPGPTNIDWSMVSGATNELQLSSSDDDLSTGEVRMRFKDNGDITMAQNEGRVGIGTNFPTNTFSVLQSTGTANTVRIQSLTHPTGKDLLELQIPVDASAQSQFIEMQKGSTIVAFVNGDGASSFTKVGVDGTPTGKLHMFQKSQTLGTGIRFTDGTANSDWDLTHRFGFTFHYGGVLKGLISATTGAYIQGSDKSLKDDITELYPVLNKIEKLRPTSYVYKDDISKKQSLGFVAQEVKQVFPEVVHYSEADGLYGVDYAAFGVIAIKAIQEQQDIIKAQNKTIESLVLRLNALEAANH